MGCVPSKLADPPEENCREVNPSRSVTKSRSDAFLRKIHDHLTGGRARSGATMTEVPFETGYGDFCFRREIVELRIKHSRQERYTRLDLPITTHGGDVANIPFIDFGGFLRSGPFPYFDLPKDIRFRILEFLIEPFCNDDGYINMSIGDGGGSIGCEACLKKWKESLLYRNLHPTSRVLSAPTQPSTPARPTPNLARRILQPATEILRPVAQVLRPVVQVSNSTTAIPNRARRGVDEISPEKKRKMLEVKEAKAKTHRIMLISNIPHPRRRVNYYLEVSPMIIGDKADEKFRPEKDMSMVHFLRGLSYVSKGFRYELGTIWWTKVSLDFKMKTRHAHNLTPPGLLLVNLFAERPCIVNSIKQLKVSLSQPGQFLQDPHKSANVDIINFWNYVSSTVNLEVLEIDVALNEEDTSLLDEEEGVSWTHVLGISKVPVSRKFVLTTKNRLALNPAQFPGIVEAIALHRRKKAWKTRLLEIEKQIRPESLLYTCETEQERYLLSRLPDPSMVECKNEWNVYYKNGFKMIIETTKNTDKDNSGEKAVKDLGAIVEEVL